VNGVVRYGEIDAARGVAVVMMILFHTVFDLSFFGIRPIEVSTGFWRFFAVSTASLFLLLAGLSLTISDERAKKMLDTHHRFLKTLRRGTWIFSLGLIVTLVTWLYLKEEYVVFGILHLIGVSIILGWFFLRLGRWNLLLGTVWIAAGVTVVSRLQGPLPLAWLGIYPAGFSSVDYTPLFPWFGVVLVGIGIGSVVYPGGIKPWNFPSFSSFIEKPLTWLGRHSLVIYLIHQPIILLIIQTLTGSSLLF
jgi:uncharacterized membrane protein